MTEAELFDAVIAYFEAIETESLIFAPSRINTTMIRGHQSAPRVDGPYAVVMLLGQRDTGEADHYCYSTATVEAEERIVEERVCGVEYLLRLDVYASDAQDRADMLIGALESRRAGIGLSPAVVSSVRRVTRAPELIEQVWEGRAAVEFQLRALVRRKTLVDVIESGTIEFEGDGGAPVAEILTYDKP